MGALNLYQLLRAENATEVASRCSGRWQRGGPDGSLSGVVACALEAVKSWWHLAEVGQVPLPAHWFPS